MLKNILKPRHPFFKVEATFTSLSETIDWSLRILNVPDIWHQSQGKNIKIAVLDTGADLDHQDLKDAIIKNKNFSNENSAIDFNGHGTATASLIGARQNKIGMIGVAPQCELLIGKVLANNGSGDFQWLARGIEWAATEGADIISMSLGAPIRAPIPYLESIVKRVVKEGKILVAASGNESQPFVGMPAAIDGIISVGAIDRNKHYATFSNMGENLDFVLPGVQVYVAQPHNRYARMSGTSFSTPILSGICGLILSKHRNVKSKTAINNVSEMIEHLKRITIDLGTPGKDKKFGFGYIDMKKEND